MAASFYSKYEVLCKIGEGSFSEVLKCQDRTTGRLFAAKRLRNPYKSAHEAANVPEAAAARKLKAHENVVHLLEQHYDALTGCVILIFELMERSLYDLLKSRVRALPEVRVRSFLHQLLRGCEHLHHHGIFHRDVKPENILVRGDCVKLGDLGSIRGTYSRPPYTEYISTRWYRSPECLLTSGFYGPKMDIWAAGCVFYEMLTLKPLFPGADEVDQLAKIHAVLGTPHPRLYAKLRRYWLQSRSLPQFPARPGCGLGATVAGSASGCALGAAGRDLLRLMLAYDPDHRAHARRLLRHPYFADLREVGSAASSVSSVCARRSGQRAPSRDPLVRASFCCARAASGSVCSGGSGTAVSSGGDRAPCRAGDAPRQPRPRHSQLNNKIPATIPMRRGCSALQQQQQPAAAAGVAVGAGRGGCGPRSCSTSFLPRVAPARCATLHAIAEAPAAAARAAVKPRPEPRRRPSEASSLVSSSSVGGRPGRPGRPHAKSSTSCACPAGACV